MDADKDYIFEEIDLEGGDGNKGRRKSRSRSGSRCRGSSRGSSRSSRSSGRSSGNQPSRSSRGSSRCSHQSGRRGRRKSRSHSGSRSHGSSRSSHRSRSSRSSYRSGSSSSRRSSRSLSSKSSRSSRMSEFENSFACDFDDFDSFLANDDAQPRIQPRLNRTNGKFKTFSAISVKFHPCALFATVPNFEYFIYLFISSSIATASLSMTASSSTRTSGEKVALATCGIYIFALLGFFAWVFKKVKESGRNGSVRIGDESSVNEKIVHKSKGVFDLHFFMKTILNTSAEYYLATFSVFIWTILTSFILDPSHNLAVSGAEIWNGNLFFSTSISFGISWYLVADIFTSTTCKVGKDYARVSYCCKRKSSLSIKSPNVIPRTWALQSMAHLVLICVCRTQKRSVLCNGAVLSKTAFCQLTTLGVVFGVIGMLVAASYFLLVFMDKSIWSFNTNQPKKSMKIEAFLSVASLFFSSLNAGLVTSTGAPGAEPTTVYFVSWICFALSLYLSILTLVRSGQNQRNQNRRHNIFKEARETDSVDTTAYCQSSQHSDAEELSDYDEWDEKCEMSQDLGGQSDFARNENNPRNSSDGATETDIYSSSLESTLPHVNRPIMSELESSSGEDNKQPIVQEKNRHGQTAKSPTTGVGLIGNKSSALRSMNSSCAFGADNAGGTTALNKRLPDPMVGNRCKWKKTDVFKSSSRSLRTSKTKGSEKGKDPSTCAPKKSNVRLDASTGGSKTAGNKRKKPPTSRSQKQRTEVLEPKDLTTKQLTFQPLDPSVVEPGGAKMDPVAKSAQKSIPKGKSKRCSRDPKESAVNAGQSAVDPPVQHKPIFTSKVMSHELPVKSRRSSIRNSIGTIGSIDWTNPATYSSDEDKKENDAVPSAKRRNSISVEDPTSYQNWSRNIARFRPVSALKGKRDQQLHQAEGQNSNAGELKTTTMTTSSSASSGKGGSRVKKNEATQQTPHRQHQQQNSTSPLCSVGSSISSLSGSFPTLKKDGHLSPIFSQSGSRDPSTQSEDSYIHLSGSSIESEYSSIIDSSSRGRSLGPPSTESEDSCIVRGDKNGPPTVASPNNATGPRKLVMDALREALKQKHVVVDANRPRNSTYHLHQQADTSQADSKASGKTRSIHSYYSGMLTSSDYSQMLGDSGEFDHKAAYAC